MYMGSVVTSTTGNQAALCLLVCVHISFAAQISVHGMLLLLLFQLRQRQAPLLVSLMLCVPAL
jgi:hypothetical protein